MTWTCRAGCSECCGPVPIPKQTFVDRFGDAQVDYEELVAYPTGEVVPVCSDGLCIFLNRKTHLCEIYSDRPRVCRDYGKRPGLECPYIKPNGRPRSPAQSRRMHRIINKRINEKLKALGKRCEDGNP